MDPSTPSVSSATLVKTDENDRPKRSIVNHIRSWIEGVSVEPVLFLHNVASQLVWVASQDLMIEKACKVNLHYNDDVCDHLKDHKGVEERVQDLVAKFSTYRSIFETCIKVIFTLFLGSWSDRWGRRRPLILSLTGLMLEPVVHLVNSQMPSWSLETILASSVPYALSGGSMALLMLCFAHLADTSKTRRRTLRMGFLDSAYYLGGPVGNAIVGPLLDTGGYKAAFGTGIAIYVVVIIYVLVRIHPIPEQQQERVEVRAVCDVSQLSEAVVVTVKPRPNRATMHILLLILAMLFDSLPVSGEMNVKYLFVMRALNWTHTQYSPWSTFASVLSALSMLVIVPILSVFAGMPDGWIGVLGGVSRTASNIIYGFVNHPSDAWLMWTGAVVASLKNMAPVSIRSLLSKLAGPQDVGKVYAVMATSESLIEFASAPMYNALYTATNDTRPGAYNFLSAGINCFLLLIILGVTLSLKKVSQRVLISSEKLKEDTDQLEKDSDQLEEDSDQLQEDSDQLEEDSQQPEEDSDQLVEDSSQLEKESNQLQKDSHQLKEDSNQLKDSNQLEEDLH